MASASYTFTHVSNSVFTTQIDLQDAAPGLVNWQAYFIRSSTSWTSYNINPAGNANAPRMDIALGGVTLGGGLVYYTYDFRTGGTANMSKTIGSGTISVPAGSTLSLTGSNDPKGSMGVANASGSFTTVPPVPVFTDSTIATTANVGSAYSDGVAASNATSYSVFSGALPTSLALNTSTGAITGTPTVPGVFTFVIRATNISGTVDTSTLTITVLGGGKVWNGSAFVAGTTKVWNGTTFVSTTTKVWNGSAWVSST